MKMKCTLFSIAVVESLSAGDPSIPRFRPVEIDTKVEIGYGVAVGDIDGDRKPDIILADKNIIVWYQNPTWEKKVIAEKLTRLDHVCVAVADIDGDGKAEIAAGAEWNPGDTINSGSVHYLVAPGDRARKWEPITLPHEPTVHRMRWAKDGSGKFRLIVVPLHGRGNKSGQGEGVKILAYSPPADPKQPWTTEVLDQSLHMTHNFDPVQWDKDPEQELLIGGKEGIFLWDRVEGKSQLTQLGGNEGGGAGEIRLGAMKGGRRFIATIEPMHGNQVVTYSPTAEARPAAGWTRRVLDESLVEGHALACGDLAGIGSDQIVVGWRATNPPGVKVGIKMFMPRDSTGTDWRQTLIDDNTMACEDLCLADLNSDGKLDIIAAGRRTKNVKIYFNEGVN